MATTMTARPSTPFPHTHMLNHGHHASHLHQMAFEQPLPHPYTARPIHFHVRPVVAPTPPSLLRKGSHVSTSTSASASTSPRLSPVSVSVPSTPHASSSRTSRATPTSTRFVAPSPRRASSSVSSSSCSSPPMPSTPILEESPARPLTPFDLPPALSVDRHYVIPTTIDEVLIPTPLESPVSDYLTEKRPAQPFSYDPYSTHLSTGEPIATGYASSWPSSPKRPSLKRRDTPVPYAQFKGSSRLRTLADIRMRSADEEDRETRVLRSVIDGGAWIIV